VRTGREIRGKGIEGEDGYSPESELIDTAVATQLHFANCVRNMFMK